MAQTYDDIIAPRNKPQLAFPTKARPVTTKPNTVRVYKSSPESVELQLRLEKHYASVALDKGEALAIAAALTKYAGQVEQHRTLKPGEWR